MSKKMKAIIVLVGAAAMLSGCMEEQIFIYEDKEYRETDLEEIMADKLEVENPGLDIEIDIYTESDEE